MSVLATSRDRVALYYRGKTAGILRKYGPGPRVHFHTGLVDRADLADASDPGEIRGSMVRAQERLLDHVASIEPALALRGTILDVGCGLGGGAIFFAQRPDCERVVAITNERSHVAVVERFAHAAGVGERVNVQRCDAHLPPAGRFDGAMAIESSCYFGRERWLRAMYARLRRGGVLHIVDCFLGREEARAWFDARWKTRIGAEREYVRAARTAGLDIAHREDLAPRAVAFWDLSVAWARASLPEGRDRDRQEAAHLRLRDALASGAIEYRWLVLRRSR